MNNIPIRIATLGNVDSGKSTLIGVISENTLDNGNGLARKCIFNHPHEQETGRTSSISNIYCNINNKKIIFTDLCGHEKYLKTTMFGLNLINPDYCFVIIGANMGIQKMTREHLGIISALQFPIIIIVTKIDIAPDNVLNDTINNLEKLIKAAKKTPLHIDANIPVNIFKKFIPIIKVSNVNGTGIDILRTYLSKLNVKKKYSIIDLESQKEKVEFLIDYCYNVHGVGLVLSGSLNKGSIKVGDHLFLTTQKSSELTEVSIKSIFDNEDNKVDKVIAGEHCTINIKEVNKKKQLKRKMITYGNVLVSENNKKMHTDFIADVYILHHQTTITQKSEKKNGFQPIIHTNGVRQAAEIIKIYNDNGVLRAHDRSRIHFRFLFNKEYIKPKSKFIFREGTSRGIGMIIDVM